MPLHPQGGLCRDLRIHQVVGEPHGHAQDDEDSPDERHALDQDSRQVPRHVQVAVDHHFHHQRIDDGDGRRLVQGREAAEHSHKCDDRNKDVPLGRPNGPCGLAQVKGRSRDLRPDRLTDPKEADRPDHDDPRQDARLEEIGDRDARYHGIEDHRETWRKQETDRTGAGQESHRESLRVPVLEQRRQKQSSYSQDRHPGGTGEGGEEATDEGGGDGQASRHPGEEGAEEADEAPAGSPLGENVSGQREEGDRWDQGGDHDPVGFHRDGGHLDAVCQKEHEGRPPEGDEDRGAQDRGGDQGGDQHPAELPRVGCQREPDHPRRHDAQRCQQAPSPLPCLDHEPQKDHSKGRRENRLCHPDRHPASDSRRRRHLGTNELKAGPQEAGRHGDRHERRDESGASAKARGKEFKPGGQGQVGSLPGGDHGSQEPDPEREVLHVAGGARDPGAKEGSQDQLQDRQDGSRVEQE